MVGCDWGASVPGWQLSRLWLWGSHVCNKNCDLKGNSLGAEICGFGMMIDMTEMLVDKFMSKCVCSPMHDVLSEKSNSTPRIAMEGVLKLGCAMFFC